nr:bifunctional [glutamate--ammonia ligase]-adenylyl-L-tyrosine phosphorylase/[glutamate--ammonia-ligase] adenylyltransferase [Sulfurifustis variabilis]
MLPAPLREAVKQRLQALGEALPPLRDPLALDWLGRLARVFAASEFAAQAATRDPAAVRDLLASGDLYRRYAPGSLAARVRDAVAEAEDEAALKHRLRVLRRREYLRLVWRDVGGAADLSEVTATLSELADACLASALDWLARRAAEVYGEPRAADGGAMGLVVLGLGKLGGYELNFSSDVDIVFAYPEDGETGGPRTISHHEFFLKLAQSLINALHEPTADGFVFRVDTRLRPFGASGPLVLSFDAMEHYYQTHGREWERYAFIKARACAGDRAAGEELLARLKPFVYRRYLDYGALDAIRGMKAMIEREVERRAMAGNLKLGPGGIREIEFIAQTHQLIRGGRERPLQERATLDLLPRLARAGYLPQAVADELREAYIFLRTSEHRLQQVADRQVHTLPSEPLERERLAFATGFADWTAYAAVLEAHRARVHQHFTALLGGEPAARPADEGRGLVPVWLGQIEPERAAPILEQAGYGDPSAVLALLKGLREGPVYRGFSTEGRARLDRLLPLLLLDAAATREPGVALARAIQIIESIGRRSAYLSLLIENGTARAQLVNLAAASPWIAAWISRHPVLLDELLDPREFYALADRAALEADLTDQLAALPEDDLEAQMERLREFKNAELLRVAAADIGPGLAPERVGAQLATLAEVVLAAALAIAQRDLERRHGAPGGREPPPGFAVIGYGKLGSHELGYASDLDMIFLYEEAEGATTTGARAIPNELYFARLGQRLIHILTTRTPAGVLYEVDMRLRPSGKAGPLVTSLPAFRRYQSKEAWTWEHQALVRARPVAGSAAVAAAFEAARREILCRSRDPDALRREVREMRARIAESHAQPHEGFDVKYDRGGIVDIEFMVQYWALRWAHDHPDVARHTDNINILETLARLGLVEDERARLLASAYRRCLSAEHRLKLMERGACVPLAELEGLPEAVAGIWNETFERE